MNDSSAATDWHARSAASVLEELNSHRDGLAAAEAQARLTASGPNRLPEPPRRSAWRRFLAQFGNLLIYVLIGAAAVTALIGHWLDTAVILGVVVINAIIGYIQEGKAEQALDALRAMLSARATVLRSGRRESIPAEELVPGDVVVLEPGDRVPADLRLLRSRELRIDQSLLTGESEPVDRDSEPVAAEAALSERDNMTYSGTVVSAGHGLGVVVATGAATEIGRIGGMLQQIQTLDTPLLRQVQLFSRQLTVAILVGAALVFAIGLSLQALSLRELFLAVVALAVAAIPEGLPAIMTIALAVGVQLMARHNAIIRRLPAVEILGSVTIICSDKTGTLTRNEMTAQTVALAAGDYSVSGSGYAPLGELQSANDLPGQERDPVLTELARAAALCNDAELLREGDQWTLHGDPTEGALLSLAMKAEQIPAELRRDVPRQDAIPFESAHRYMATLHHDHEHRAWVYLKGAPEVILPRCSRQRGADGDASLNHAAWQRRVDAIAAAGQRVLALAVHVMPPGSTTLNHDDVSADLTLLGLVGIMDPPREEAIRAVAECQGAGIRVKMITGDHIQTALAIAGRIGIVAEAKGARALSGAEIEQLDDAALQRAAADIDVFARASPEHKLRLVMALQARHEVVAMTGDGVNDAPALRRADIGIAMGRKGTEAAKEASEMVLADDNFATIAEAVRHGRTVYTNLVKSILYLLPVSGGQALALIVALLLGQTLPVTALQILWVNMVTSVTLAMSLAFEPTEKDVMQRPPRPVDTPLFSGLLLWLISFVSLLFVAGVYGMFHFSLAQGASVELARSTAVNTLVVMEVFYLFSVRYLYRSSLTAEGVRGTPAVLIAVATVIVLQLGFTYLPFMQTFFQTRPIPASAALTILAVGVICLLLLELEKGLRRRWQPAPRPAIQVIPPA